MGVVKLGEPCKILLYYKVKSLLDELKRTGLSNYQKTGNWIGDFISLMEELDSGSCKC